LPDSLAELRRMAAQARPNDPALLALAERVVAQRQSARGAKPADVADAIEWLGRVQFNRVDYIAADSLFERAVALRRSERKPAPLALASTLALQAESQRVTKHLARAESTATQVLAMIDQRALRDTVLMIRVQHTLGNVLAERGQATRACEALAVAVRLGESRAHPDSILLGQSHRFLARAMSVAGDLRGARASYARAAAIQEAALGPDNPELATTLLLTAMVASSEGDYVAQRRLAERALAIREKTFGPDHPVVAITVSTLGGALRNLGDIESALPLYERAVAIQRASKRGGPFDLALALNNLGSALLVAGDGARARTFLEEARAVREKAFGPGAGSNPWSVTQLANAMWITGDLPAARSEIERAVALVDSANFADTVLDLAEALQIQGGIARTQGREADALVAYERAYALSDSILGAESSSTIEALANLAIIRAESGKSREAWADAKRLDAQSRRYLQLSARSLSEHEALLLQRSRASGLDLMLSLAAGPQGAEPGARLELADAVVRARLLVLDQLADERRALPFGDPALAAPVKELEDARDALARAMVDALRQGRALDSTVVMARARREIAERELAARSERFDFGLRRSDVGFAEVIGAMPPRSALVSYLRHDPPSLSLRASTVEDSSALAARRYSAMVLPAGAREPVLISLGSAAPLERAIALWLEACATPPSADPALARAAERRCDALGRTVRTLAWGPIARVLGAAERVFVVPDGALHTVNFLALPDARGGYLVERGPTLHRLTAERDLLPWGASDGAGHGLLALGGADFDHAEDSAGEPLALAATSTGLVRAGTPDSLRLHFPSLPQTAEEAAQVAALWRTSGSPDAADVAESSGRAASESAFKRLAPGRRVLHVATHGFALGDGASRGGVNGARGIGAVVGGARPGARERRAVLLPGLALAGANVPHAAESEDGFLTAEEITSLDLSGAEWAVLSACETGFSDPRAPEAVQGLQRAFRRAGVHTVIMSLWAVDDVATRGWMRQLYSARLGEHLDTATAMRLACRRVLSERRAQGRSTHPFGWAAFVAAGDWR